MVEVHDIARYEKPPEGGRVVIEPAGGRFVANGVSPAKGSEGYWRPPAFDTLDEAIAASIEWASKNDVFAVYVKRIVRGRPRR